MGSDVPISDTAHTYSITLTGLTKGVIAASADLNRRVDEVSEPPRILDAIVLELIKSRELRVGDLTP